MAVATMGRIRPLGLPKRNYPQGSLARAVARWSSPDPRNGDFFDRAARYASEGYSHVDERLGRFAMEEQVKMRVATLNLWGPGGRSTAAEDSSCRTSVSISLQVQHRRASLRERCREGGIAAILDLRCAGVLRLAADDAVPPDRVGVGFQSHGERVSRFVRLEDEVLFAGIRERVPGRAEVTPGLPRDETHFPREA